MKRLLPLLLLFGCASVPEQEPYWERTWEGAITTNIHVVSRSPWGEGVQGWTVCDKARRHCDILIVANADRECVETHERKHAAGLDHPKYRRAFICH